MNDPGLDQPIKEVQDGDVEGIEGKKAEELEREEQEDFLDPSRWWFASTACPLLAGTFGPMANAFSICALAVYWREYIPDGGTEAHGSDIKDPKWLTAVNSVSLAFALIANMALLLNMARRLSFAIAQTITIVGWIIASFLLIGLVSAASTSAFRMEPAENHALTQAYYYAIMAAALYFIVSGLMIVTVYGAWKGHYAKEFRLTMVQRTLMMQTIAFLGYLLLGACIYSYIEDWPFLDAVYWADFTLLTVGIGSDFVPKTHAGRSLLFPYAVGGIVTVGLVIGSIRSLILDRGKAKLTARMVEKRREGVLDTANLEKRTIKIGSYHTIAFSQKGLTEPQRREQEFHIMRKIKNDATARRKWIALALSTTAAFTLWFLGAVVFRIAERKQGWSYFVALYFSYTSLLTIGYGDLQPTSNSGKPFFVFWSLLAVPTLTVLISNMGDTVVKAISDLTNWAGSLTILPGENGVKAAWRASLERFSTNKIYRQKGFHTTLPGRPEVTQPYDDDGEGRNHARDVQDRAKDRLSQYLKDEELKEAGVALSSQDAAERDRHFYHYVLVREVRQLMKDAQASPAVEYSYTDWAWFLKLIGQDEANADHHCKPPVLPHEKEEDLDEDPAYMAQANGKEGNLKWSWLGTRSPLMGNKTEAEWLLEKLSATLEKELYSVHSKKVRKSKPPVGLSDILKHDKSEAKDADKEVKRGDGAEKGTGSNKLDKRASSGSRSSGDSSSTKDDQETAGGADMQERSMQWE